MATSSTHMDGDKDDINIGTHELPEPSCAVNRLPIEVLDATFDLASEPMTCDLVSLACVPQNPQPEFTHSWLRLSMVCRQWHRIIFSPAARWANINIDASQRPASQIQLATLCLQNAGSRLLNVRITSYVNYRWVKAHIMKQSGRFKSLILLDEGCHRQQEFRYPAPNLQRLTLQAGEHVYQHTLNQLLLFSGIVPQLRSLHLINYRLWPANYITCLTHLTINSQHGLIFDQALLYFLEQNPNLQQLVLMDFDAIHDDFHLDRRTAKLDMLCLQEVMLWSCNPYMIVLLLDYLHFASDNFRFGAHANGDLCDVPLRTYDIGQFSGVTDLAIEGSRKPFASTCAPRFTGFGSTTFDLVPYDLNLIELSCCLLRACNVEQIILHASFTTIEMLGTSTWCTILTSLSSVKTITILNDPPIPLTSYMELLCTHHGSLGLLCPLLAELVVRGPATILHTLSRPKDLIQDNFRHRTTLLDRVFRLRLVITADKGPAVANEISVFLANFECEGMEVEVVLLESDYPILRECKAVVGAYDQQWAKIRNRCLYDP